MNEKITRNNTVYSFFNWSKKNPLPETKDLAIDLRVIAAIFSELGYKIKNTDGKAEEDEPGVSKIIFNCGKSGKKCVLIKESSYCDCDEGAENAYWEVISTSRNSLNVIESGSSLTPALNPETGSFIQQIFSFLNYSIKNQSNSSVRERHSLPAQAKRKSDGFMLQNSNLHALNERKSIAGNEFQSLFATPMRYKSLDTLTAQLVSPEPGLLISNVDDAVFEQRSRMNSVTSSVCGSVVSSVESTAFKFGRVGATEKIISHLESALKLLKQPPKSGSLLPAKSVPVKFKTEERKTRVVKGAAPKSFPVPEAASKIKTNAKYAHVKSTIPKISKATKPKSSS